MEAFTLEPSPYCALPPECRSREIHQALRLRARARRATSFPMPAMINRAAMYAMRTRLGASRAHRTRQGDTQRLDTARRFIKADMNGVRRGAGRSGAVGGSGGLDITRHQRG